MGKVSETWEGDVAGHKDEMGLKDHVTWAQQLLGLVFCQSLESI